MITRREVRERRRLRSRRLRAVLAGGVVLGIGVAATLAAWNDSEYGSASFTAGKFDIVGAVDGATFSNHATAGTAATLNFQLVPTAMAPGNSTYALFSVKTANPSVAGTVQLIAGTPTGTGLAAHLTYGVRTIAGTTCNSTTYAAGTAVVADGSALTAGGATTQAVTANGATQVNYCFAVTLPLAAPNAAQGLTMTQTWQFLGTSS
ncbi:SipW-dependent-type signal peptide-containing protein [Microbacterium oxydans]|uniref:SipW-dependent-type signal peptide-containing protein n=1 Tax=Microbacterium TaxID=33882 RepID=UPI000FD88B30|nr:SipW-dependent-type signal peptide-containing protein [Microbacterium oxydans]